MKSITTLIASTVSFSSLSFAFNVELAKSTMSMIIQLTTDAKISAETSSDRSYSERISVSNSFALSSSKASNGICPNDDTVGNRPGAPNVRIFASKVANSGASPFGPMRALRSVSLALALFFEKIPSFLFGLTRVDWGGSVASGGGVGFATFGASGLAAAGFDFVIGSKSSSSSSSLVKSSTSSRLYSESSSLSSDNPMINLSCLSRSSCAAELFSL
mmetsp:Transcript_185/g.436  ORF Transcript_185/g.436 Transcript_185/m.436 type:complete len:217 (-) Transcript_185:431-1081(-)